MRESTAAAMKLSLPDHHKWSERENLHMPRPRHSYPVHTAAAMKPSLPDHHKWSERERLSVPRPRHSHPVMCTITHVVHVTGM